MQGSEYVKCHQQLYVRRSVLYLTTSQIRKAGHYTVLLCSDKTDEKFKQSPPQ